MVSSLVCLRIERDIVLCSWARQFTLTVPLSTQVHKWVPTHLILGVTLRWTNIPFKSLHVTEIRDKRHLMGHVARMHTSPLYRTKSVEVNFSGIFRESLLCLVFFFHQGNAEGRKNSEKRFFDSVPRLSTESMNGF